MKFRNFLKLGAIISVALVAELALADTPECVIQTDANNNRYIISFTLPSYTLEDGDGSGYIGSTYYCTEDDCGDFTEIMMEQWSDHDITDIPSYPQLPFYSLHLLLPDNATSVNVFMEDDSYETAYPHLLIRPTLKGTDIVSINGVETETAQDTACYNSVYYQQGYDTQYPNGFYKDFLTTSSVYSFLDTKGVTLSIFPFSYSPESDLLDVLSKATIYVEFDGDNLNSRLAEINSFTNNKNSMIQLYYDNFHGGGTVLPPITDTRYLIVAAHRSMATSLIPYISYKSGQSYDVSVLYLDDYQNLIGNAVNIRQAINNYYNSPYYPEYVLLVGSLSEIPPFVVDGIKTDTPYDNFLGRWIVGEGSGFDPELSNIVEKTILSETGYTQIQSLATLFSGTYSTNSMEPNFIFSNTNRNFADTAFYSSGIPYILYEGGRSNIGFASMHQALSYNPIFFVYTGKGKLFMQNSTVVGSGIHSPYYVCPNGMSQTPYYEISALENEYPFPLGFGFAGYLNSYDTNNSFGAQWVNQVQGGCSFYGSTSYSWLPDRNFARIVARAMKKTIKREGNPMLHDILFLAECWYKAAMEGVERNRIVNAYNLIGDPTIHVFGMSATGEAAPFHMPAINDTAEGTTSAISRTDLYTLDGRLVRSNIIPGAPLGGLPSGVYVQKQVFEDGTVISTKISH